MPSSSSVRITRMAISPRLATRTLSNIAGREVIWPVALRRRTATPGVAAGAALGRRRSGRARSLAARAAPRFERCGGVRLQRALGWRCRWTAPAPCPAASRCSVEAVRARRRGGPHAAARRRARRRARASRPRRRSRATALGAALPGSTGTATVIVFDQRGTGRSGLLRCRRARASQSAGRRRTRPAACARRLGPRRAFYTTPRHGRGHRGASAGSSASERVALYGTSYGTKVALGYALRYPARVERLVLDSVVEVGGPDPFYLDTFGGRAACAAVALPARSAPGRGIRWPTSRPSWIACARGSLRGRVVDARGRPRAHAPHPRRPASRSCSRGDFDPALRAAFPGAVRAALRGDRRAAAAAAPARIRGGRRAAAAARCSAPRSTRPRRARRPRSRGLAPRRPTRASGTGRLRPGRATIPDCEFQPFDRATALASDVLNLCERWPSAPPAPPSSAQARCPTCPCSCSRARTTCARRWRTPSAWPRLFPRSSLVVAPATGHSALGSDFSGCADRAFGASSRAGRWPPAAGTCGALFPPQPPPPQAPL